MFISMIERETPLFPEDEAYINAMGDRVLDFGRKLDSQMHAHLTQRMMQHGEQAGLSSGEINNIVNTVHHTIKEDDLTEDEMKNFIRRLTKGDEDLAVEIHYHVKFTHALGMAVIAYGLDTLELTEPGDPTVQGTMDDLHDVLKEMKYGDWEVKMMKQRFTTALHDFSVEYLGARGRA